MNNLTAYDLLHIFHIILWLGAIIVFILVWKGGSR